MKYYKFQSPLLGAVPSPNTLTEVANQEVVFQSPLLGAVPSPLWNCLLKQVSFLFQSPLLGAVPSPGRGGGSSGFWADVSIPSSGGSAFTPPDRRSRLLQAIDVSIPSSGGSAFTLSTQDVDAIDISFNPLFWGQCLHPERAFHKERCAVFQSPLLGAVPSPFTKKLVDEAVESFNPLFWGQCLHHDEQGRVGKVGCFNPLFWGQCLHLIMPAG